MLVVCMSMYLASVASLLFVGDPVFFVLLLVMQCLSVGVCLFSLLGFSWYLLLFLLVYVGGVFVLFIFISVSMRKFGLTSKVEGYLLMSVFVGSMVGGQFMLSSVWFCDESLMLCSSSEGLTYCVLSLLLVLGLSGVSWMSSTNKQFFR